MLSAGRNVTGCVVPPVSAQDVLAAVPLTPSAEKASADAPSMCSRDEEGAPARTAANGRAEASDDALHGVTEENATANAMEEDSTEEDATDEDETLDPTPMLIAALLEQFEAEKSAREKYSILVPYRPAGLRYTTMDVVAHMVVRETMKEYVASGRLSELSEDGRMRLAAQVIGEFLRMPSCAAGGPLPFTAFPSRLDPVGMGLVTADSAVVARTEGRERQELTYTFTTAQMLMATAFYGADPIPLGPAPSYHMMAVCTLALYVSALAECDAAALSAHDCLRALDPLWRGGSAAATAALEGGLRRRAGEALQPPLYVRWTPTTAAEGWLPRAEPEGEGEGRWDGGATRWTAPGRLTARLRRACKRRCVTAVVTPLLSPHYAEGFVVCGRTLFVVRAEQAERLGAAEAEVRTRLLRMGLVPEGTAAAALAPYARNIALTGEICAALGIACVVPVFCADARPPASSAVHTVRVRMASADEVASARSTIAAEAGEAGERGDAPRAATATALTEEDAYVYPLTCKPGCGLVATFTRTVAEGDTATPWAYACTTEDAAPSPSEQGETDETTAER